MANEILSWLQFEYAGRLASAVESMTGEPTRTASGDTLDEPIAPTSGVINAAILWAVTAAYIEAMERRGKPPQVWMSIKRPGAQEFNAAAREAAQKRGY